MFLRKIRAGFNPENFGSGPGIESFGSLEASKLAGTCQKAQVPFTPWKQESKKQENVI